MPEQTMQQIVSVGAMIFVLAPLLILIFVGLVTLIKRTINEEIGSHPAGNKSVEALINQAKGYGPLQPDPMETRVKQLVQEGQRQVEEEIMDNFDRIVTIIRKETNHK